MKKILYVLSVASVLMSCGSETYRKCMHACQMQEKAINNANSIFDMPALNQRIISVTDFDCLSGDERANVYNRHEAVWELYKTKCMQLAGGYYLLTSEDGQKYVVELSEDTGSDGNQAYVYIDNHLYSKGYWYLSDYDPTFIIRHNPINEEYRSHSDLEINLSIENCSWSGDIDNIWKITIFPDGNERARIKKIETDYNNRKEGSLKKMDNITIGQFSKNTYTPNSIKPLISTMEIWRKACLDKDLDKLHEFFADNVEWEWKNEQYSKDALLEQMEKRLYNINSAFSSYYWISPQKDIVVIERYPYGFTFSRTAGGWKIIKVNM